MAQFKLKVTKTVNGKREEVGVIALYCPTLEDILPAVQAAKVTETDEEGLPVYDSHEANWVMSALRGSAAASARNKLEKGTVELKPGLSIATSLAELAEPSTGGGNAEYLSAVAKLNALFRQYVDSLGKAAKTSTLIVECFRSQKALAMQPQDLRDKLKPYFEGFAQWLADTGAEEEINEYAAAHYGKVMSLLEVEDEEDAFGDL